MIKIILLVAAFIADIFVGSNVGIGFAQSSLSVTPNILFITLILVTYKEPHFKSFLTAIVVGLIMDSFNRDVLFLNTAIYIITVFIVSAWSTRVNYSIIELFFTVLAAVFVKEILLYLYYTVIVGMNITVETFMTNHLLYTLLLNIVFTIIAVFIKKASIEQEIYKQQINRRRASMSNKY